MDRARREVSWPRSAETRVSPNLRTSWPATLPALYPAGRGPPFAESRVRPFARPTTRCKHYEAAGAAACLLGGCKRSVQSRRLRLSQSSLSTGSTGPREREFGWDPHSRSGVYLTLRGGAPRYARRAGRSPPRSRAFLRSVRVRATTALRSRKGESESDRGLLRGNRTTTAYCSASCFKTAQAIRLASSVVDQKRPHGRACWKAFRKPGRGSGVHRWEVIRCHGELMRHGRNSFSARAIATGSPLDGADGRLR
jgi:hypothetical protein